MVSPRKPPSLLKVPSKLPPPPPVKCMANSVNSCESLFSTSSKESASAIYQQKLPLPRGSGGQMRNVGRQPSIVNPSSVIQQRVMSARNLRIKTFQNQLADAQHEIANLAHENRTLRTLHKRQDNALAKYESSNADLPRLLNSHAEELRVWQTKSRNFQALNKDLEAKLKQKEAQILALSDQNKHYSQLNKDKSLDERQRLQEKLRTLEQRLQEKDNDMKMMARRMQLEIKNYKQQLLSEQKKSKELTLKLEKAKLEISGYRKLEELSFGDKTPHGRRSKDSLPEEPEKSLETLNKAIQHANQSELNALNKDFNIQEDGDNKSALGSARSGSSTKLVRSESKMLRNDLDGTKVGRQDIDSKFESKPPRNPARVSLPPAALIQRDTGKSILGQVLSNKSREGSLLKLPIDRMRSGGMGETFSKFSTDRINKSILNPKSKTLKSVNLSPDMSGSFDYDEDGYESKSPEEDGPSDSEELAESKDLINMAAYEAYMDVDVKASHADFDNIDDDDDEPGDDEEQDNDSVILNTKIRTANMKEEISSLRKQISDDYKEREAFLDTFCRQASGSMIRDDPALKKRNSIANAGSHISAGRKNQLLAALKAIDDNKSQD